MPVLTIARASWPGGMFRRNCRFWIAWRGLQVEHRDTRILCNQTFYHNLGIDPATTVADRGGRPMALLDEREPIRELI